MGIYQWYVPTIIFFLHENISFYYFITQETLSGCRKPLATKFIDMSLGTTMVWMQSWFWLCMFAISNKIISSFTQDILITCKMVIIGDYNEAKANLGTMALT
jgi:hypothetical protein